MHAEGRSYYLYLFLHTSKRHTKNKPVAISKMQRILSLRSVNKNIIEQPPNRITRDMANTLVPKDMHFLSCQSLMRGPNILFDNNHRCHFSDDFAKQPADTSKKGVAGNNGKNTPITPRPKNINTSNLYSDMLITWILQVIPSGILFCHKRIKDSHPITWNQIYIREFEIKIDWTF